MNWSTQAGKALRLLVAFGITLVAGNALAQVKPLASLGVILMHGKGGQPGGFIRSLSSALESEGALTSNPRMAWSGIKGVPHGYNLTFDQAIAELDHEITKLQSDGAIKIVVAGQSLGASAALAYAANSPEKVSAVIMMAAGHVPERFNRIPQITSAVSAARELVAQGKGLEPGSYPDINQGRASWVPGNALSYLSYFEPEGPANMQLNAVKLSSMPVLYVIGRHDPLYRAGRGYVIDRLPPHPMHRYIEIDAGHLDTPDKAVDEVVRWLKALKP